MSGTVSAGFYNEPIWDDGWAVYVLIHEIFYTAGRTFGWHGNITGIGLNEQILEYASKNGRKIRVLLDSYDDRCYQIDPNEWIQFAKGTHSIMDRKKSGEPLPTLYVVQFDSNHFKTIKLDVALIKSEKFGVQGGR